MRTARFLVLIFALLSLLLSFQNCGKLKPVTSNSSQFGSIADGESNLPPPQPPGAPVIEIQSRPNPFSSADSAQVEFTVQDPEGLTVTSLQCSLDGSPFSDCVSPVALSGVAEGAHNIAIQATNEDGITGSAQVEWVVDLTPSMVTIMSGPALSTDSVDAEFTFSVTDMGAGIGAIECRLNDLPFAACSSPINYAALDPGTYTFELRGTDLAGNVASETYSWSAGVPPLGNGQGMVFFSVRGVAANPAGTHVYIFDLQGRTLLKVDLANGNRTVVSSPSVGDGPRLGNAQVTIHPQETFAYVVETTTDAIIQIDLSNGNRSILTSPAIGAGPAFNIITDVVAHPNETTLLVADRGINAIASVDLATGDRTVIADEVTGAGPEVEAPSGITINADGTSAYYVDFLFDTLVHLDLATGNRTVVSSAATGAGAMWDDPYKVVIDTLETQAYVFDRPLNEEHRLFRVDLATGNRTIISSAAIGAGPSLNNAYGLALNAGATAAYLAQGDPDVVLQVDLANGNRSILSNGSVGPGSISNPSDIIANADASITYVLHREAGAVVRIDMTTGVQAVVSSAAVGAGPVIPIGCRGMTGDAAATFAYVSCSAGSTVYRVELATGNRTIVSNSGTGAGTTFSDPLDIAINAAGTHVYVIDNGPSGVVRIDLANGNKTIVASDSVGVGPVISALIGDIAIDPNETSAYVTISDSIYRIDLATGDRTVVTSATVGVGPSLGSVSDIQLNANATTAYTIQTVGETVGMISIDLATGNRAEVSGWNAGFGTSLISPIGLAISSADPTKTVVSDPVLDAIFEVNLVTGNRQVKSK